MPGLEGARDKLGDSSREETGKLDPLGSLVGEDAGPEGRGHGHEGGPRGV